MKTGAKLIDCLIVPNANMSYNKLTENNCTLPTHLTEFPVVDEFRTVSVNERTEAQAIFPAERGEINLMRQRNTKRNRIV